MPLDLGTKGLRVGPHTHRYDWRDVALYALGLGAGTDDLDYLLDPSPHVLPTYAVIPAFGLVMEAMQKTGGDLVQLLHTGQRTELVRPLPPSGEMQTSAEIRGLWDMKIGALVIVDTQSEVDGELVCRTSWQLLLRADGGFRGERPPRGLKTKPPKDKAPSFEARCETSLNQALLYRLNGDVNPIHSHPDVARQAGFDRPILHGLCTYGITARLALKHMAGDDPSRLRAFEARFSEVVMPGDALIVRGYELDEPGSAAITATIESSGKLAIGHALLEYVP